MTGRPKITVIVVLHRLTRDMHYFPNFFASVRANPDISFLLVKYHQWIDQDIEDPNKNCFMTPGLEKTPNAKEICLGYDEYWDRHTDYMCARWGCNSDEKSAVNAKMKERAKRDIFNTFFRPFRASIFSEWVDPSTLIWGACDVDEMWGNFERTFPWDLASQFDILVPASPGGDGATLVYTRGHMTFFRHSQYVVDQMMTMPNIRDVRSYMHDPFLLEMSDESEWSHFIIMNPKLTFITFPALDDHTTSISTLDGVFGLEGFPSNRMPSERERSELISTIASWRSSHLVGNSDHGTFSRSGIERPATIHSGAYANGLWFPKEFSVYYDAAPSGGDTRRFLLRRVADGAVTERLEGTAPFRFKLGNLEMRMMEGLYKHFQGEKYKPFWNLPEESLGVTGDYLLTRMEEGVEVWDRNGNVVFQSLNLKSQK